MAYDSYRGVGAPLRADTAAEVVRTVIRDVAAHGTVRYSDNDLAVCELLAVNTVLTEPRARLLRSPSSPHIFNPGLAVARFFYLISGSHDLDAIAFYSPAAARFTDDGITMPGGAHGFRLFHPVSSVDQFQGVLNALRQHPERNRAAVSFYHPQDCGSPTADLTCVMGAMFTRKDGLLHALVNMRANDALRLLWHDMFEFSMLGEYVARMCGFELGHYYHSSFVMMLIGRTAIDAADTVAAESDVAPIMDPMPAVTAETRGYLVRHERRIRAVVADQSSAQFRNLLDRLVAEEPSYWADLLISLALQGRMIRLEPEAAIGEQQSLDLPEHLIVANETVRNSLKLAHARTVRPMAG